MAPLNKKQIDMNNIQHKSDRPTTTPNKKINTQISSASGNWLVTDTKNQVNSDGTGYNMREKRGNEMQSSLDGHGYQRPSQQADLSQNNYKKDFMSPDVRKTQQ